MYDNDQKHENDETNNVIPEFFDIKFVVHFSKKKKNNLVSTNQNFKL